MCYHAVTSLPSTCSCFYRLLVPFAILFCYVNVMLPYVMLCHVMSCHVILSAYHFFTKQCRKPLVVRDVLNVGDHDSPRLLEESLIAPVRVKKVKKSSNSIMFTCKKDVNCHQRYKQRK